MADCCSAVTRVSEHGNVNDLVRKMKGKDERQIKGMETKTGRDNGKNELKNEKESRCEFSV
jgi:hypothetical protein